MRNTVAFMATLPMDMRRGFDSLAAWVDKNLGRKVLDGDVFSFPSKRRYRIKIMWWEGDGGLGTLNFAMGNSNSRCDNPGGLAKLVRCQA